MTYRATPNIETTTIGGVHHAMQSFKTIIIDRFKMFHGVKVHFNVEGMCLYMGKIFKCITFLDIVRVGIVSFFILASPLPCFQKCIHLPPSPYYNNLITF